MAARSGTGKSVIRAARGNSGIFHRAQARYCGVVRKALDFSFCMPTYEYECAKCKQTFDVFQSMKDEALKVCPDKKCKGKVKRLIGTGAGLIFKGSGFYITDYRSEGYKQAAKKDSGAAAPAKSTETKPAAPTSSKKADGK